MESHVVAAVARCTQDRANFGRRSPRCCHHRGVSKLYFVDPCVLLYLCHGLATRVRVCGCGCGWGCGCRRGYRCWCVVCCVLSSYTCIILTQVHSGRQSSPFGTSWAQQPGWSQSRRRVNTDVFFPSTLPSALLALNFIARRVRPWSFPSSTLASNFVHSRIILVLLAVSPTFISTCRQSSPVLF